MKILSPQPTTDSSGISVDDPPSPSAGRVISCRTPRPDGSQKMADLLAGDHPSITLELLPSSRHRLWARSQRGCARRSLLAYLDPRWDNAAKPRAAQNCPPFAVAVARMPVLGSRGRTCRADACSARSRPVIPPPGEIADVFSASPRHAARDAAPVFPFPPVDHVRCARQLGIKSVLGVGS